MPFHVQVILQIALRDETQLLTLYRKIVSIILYSKKYPKSQKGVLKFF